MEHTVIPTGKRHGPHDWEVADQAARLALVTTVNDYGHTCWQKSDNTVWVSTAANTWAQLGGGAAPVTSVAGKTGAVTLAKADVGLSNVDNTADTAKPVSTAQQSALDLKAPLASPAFTGTPTGITKAHVGLANVDNTADTAKPVSTAQQAALDLKAPLASPAFTGTPTGITKTHVGLANVDNTSDANKPVSAAQQSALDAKAPINNPTFTGTVGGVTKAHVGLGNVDNTSDANKPISTAQQAALNLKAPLGPTIQTARSGASTLELTDDNTIIPFSAAATLTVPSGLAATPDLLVEGVRTGSGVVTLARGSGTVLIFEGADVASVTLNADGSRFVLMGSSTANKYYAYRIGA